MDYIFDDDMLNDIDVDVDIDQYIKNNDIDIIDTNKKVDNLTALSLCNMITPKNSSTKIPIPPKISMSSMSIIHHNKYPLLPLPTNLQSKRIDLSDISKKMFRNRSKNKSVPIQKQHCKTTKHYRSTRDITNDDDALSKFQFRKNEECVTEEECLSDIYEPLDFICDFDIFEDHSKSGTAENDEIKTSTLLSYTKNHVSEWIIDMNGIRNFFQKECYILNKIKQQCKCDMKNTSSNCKFVFSEKEEDFSYIYHYKMIGVMLLSSGPHVLLIHKTLDMTNMVFFNGSDSCKWDTLLLSNLVIIISMSVIPKSILYIKLLGLLGLCQLRSAVELCTTYQFKERIECVLFVNDSNDIHIVYSDSKTVIPIHYACSKCVSEFSDEMMKRCK